MAIFEIFLFALMTLLLLCMWRRRTKTSKNTSFLPTNWPLVGMFPGLILNSHRIHAYSAHVLNETGGSFYFKLPRYLNTDMFFTSDPANIHHIFTTNYSNYPKAPQFGQIFEIFGDGIFNVDGERWEFLRKTSLSVMTHFDFYNILERSVWERVENGLLPVLDYFAKQGVDFDLQDVFQRFTFDSICKVVLDCDPRSLSVEMPYVKCEKAFNDVIEVLFYRHILPECIWKLQKWLGIGKEKKLVEAWKAFDEFIYPLIDDLNEVDPKTDGFNVLASIKEAYEEEFGAASDELRDSLKDTALASIFAGRGTTSNCLTWLFWLIATNPSTENKILEEIETQLNLKEDNKKWRFFKVQESKKLIYLHGALCESLRLFPPVALEHKAPIRPDHLPSGNYIPENIKVIISFYSMGRTEAIWGKDCLEFKPERWISPSGGIKHVPSYKFPAFNVGPRSCLGKEMSFIQMKMVAATILYRYNVRLVEGHPVSPLDSIMLQARNGLRVKLSERIV